MIIKLKEMQQEITQQEGNNRILSVQVVEVIARMKE